MLCVKEDRVQSLYTYEYDGFCLEALFLKHRGETHDEGGHREN